MALIPDDPRQRNAALIAVVTLALFYLFWSMWYTPRGEELAEWEAHLEQLEQQNRRARILAARGGDDLRERLELYERHVVRLEQLIPQSEEVPTLLNDITATGNRIDVVLDLLSPQPPEPGPFYTKQSYRIDVIGAYHDVGRFLADIASLSRIITPVEMELRPYEGEESDLDAENPVLASFRIETYVVPSGTGAPPAAGAQETTGGDE